MRPKLLDLFCKAGGCSAGYSRAGFDCVGVDIEPQPHYPYTCLEADALDVLRGLLAGASVLGYYLDDFAAIHASPPCQAWTVLKHLHVKRHPELVAPVRELLMASGKVWVIENVVGAPLLSPVMLCGSSFGMDIRRHRLFESNVPLMVPPCEHGWQKPRFPANRSDRRKANAKACVVSVAGHDTRYFNHVASVHGGTQGAGGVAEWRRAMGIDWMTRDELSQAIPPAYTEFIGRQLISLIGV